MPLTDRDKKILKSLKKQHPKKKAEEIFYKMEALGKTDGPQPKKKPKKKGGKKK